MKKLFVAVAFLLASALVVLCLRGIRVKRYQDSYVSAGKILKPLQLINVHESTPQYITIYGKTYTGIRGLAPYYLKMPTREELIFVSETEGNPVAVFRVDLGTKTICKIDVGDSIFGWDIGSGRKPNERYSNWVEAGAGSLRTIITRTADVRIETTLDFANKFVEGTRTVYLDKDGNETKRVADGK